MSKIRKGFTRRTKNPAYPFAVAGYESSRYFGKYLASTSGSTSGSGQSGTSTSTFYFGGGAREVLDYSSLAAQS
jgi:hypothetical protein